MIVDQAFEYASDVISGKVLAGKYIKLSCKKFLSELKNQDDLDHYFNQDKAEEVLEFVQTFKHHEGDLAGTKFILSPWQVFFVANVYGWLRKVDNQRRYRKALLYVGRGNGKTFLAATLALYDIATETGGLAVSVATSSEQAALTFDYMKLMVNALADDPEALDEDGNPIFEVYTNAILCRGRNSKYRVKSSSVGKMQGFHPTLLIADEISSYPDTYRIIDVIESGMATRKQPLTLMITTGERDTHTVGYLEFERAKKVLTNILQDETYFALLYLIDEKDNWANINCLYKANPNLGVSISLNEVESRLKEAKIFPEKETEFRVKTANTFVQGVHSSIPDKHAEAAKSKYTKYKKMLTDEYLATCPCAGGIDLSERYDFTAYTLYWYIEELKFFYARHKIYIPEKQIETKMRRDSPMIMAWVTEKYITATPGDVIDQSYLFKDIEDDLSKFKIKEIGYDERLSSNLVFHFTEKYPDLDVPLVSISNTMTKQNEFLGEWEEVIVTDKLIDGNPVFRWMVSNATITSRNGMKFVEKIQDRRVNSRRIDAVDTSIMAYNCLLPYISNSTDDLNNLYASWGFETK